MPLAEIVLRVPHREDEVRLAEVKGGGDGSVISVDGRDWFVMMTMRPEGTEARRRLICVRVEGLD
jgi:hypothetical protein